jgi:hypothetical protein
MSKASKTVLVLFMGLLFAGKAHVQEVKHAPTIEQCRADQRLWVAKLEDTTAFMPETMDALTGWTGEMYDCMSVDPENRIRYYNVTGEIWATKGSRFMNFLKRHNLYEQFIEEDKAGKR